MTQQKRSPGPPARARAEGRDPDRRRGRPTARRPGCRSLSWSFPGTPADVSHSRRWLAAAAAELWGEGEDTDRLVLAYSEIATNAVVHGTGPVSVAADISPTGARCEVADRSTELPRPRATTEDDLSGRGLEMVRNTVDRLLVAADDEGKTVSFVVGRHRDTGDGDTGHGGDGGDGADAT